MSAEMEARRTAAAAALADFRHGDEQSMSNPFAGRTDYRSWSFRLAAELNSLLAQLDTETQGPAEAQVAQIRLVLDQVLGDELADRQYALEQIHDILRGDL